MGDLRSAASAGAVYQRVSREDKADAMNGQVSPTTSSDAADAQSNGG
jgi:hypothetical protein